MKESLLLPRPFLKWAGGKTQLADDILQRMPVRFNTYFEPFVGSGAIFFRLYREKKIRHAVLSDINAELIDTYKAIRDCVDEVIEYLSGFPHEKSFYYELRAKDPWSLTLPERAARMIYLNKTGYNGLYRVNRQGKFNVPFGKYKSPNYLDKENLKSVSYALQKVELVCASFEIVLQKSNPGDWVYFDPPYVPLSQTANFTSYYSNGFTLRDQEKLRDICIELTKKNVYVTLSNSDTSITTNLFSYPFFSRDIVYSNRAINCNGSKRGKITELIIANYPMQREIQLRLLENHAPYLVNNSEEYIYS
jgi:DNA adenine methylase